MFGNHRFPFQAPIHLYCLTLACSLGLASGGGALQAAGPDTFGGLVASLPADMSPANWVLRGDSPQEYSLSLDPALFWEGKPVHILASQAKAGKSYGTIMQMFKGKGFLGKRVRLSVLIKTEQVDGWAGAWMRADMPNGEPATFDNMQGRPIQGSQEWQSCQVVLDLPPDALALALGVLLYGKGKVWMAEPTLEIVDASVPVTATKKAGLGQD